MSQQSIWQRMKSGGKTGFDQTWKALDRIGAPMNKLTNKIGSEAFWPTTLDKESDKAARILKSFCKDGFYAEEEFQPEEGPKMKQRVIQKIPEKVIRNAKGLAIFTTMRMGLWMSGAGGSGILIARKADGTWSPPSGILLHTAGLGFLIGVDIYDCVVVINTEEALQAFTRVRCTLGSEVSVAAGPFGAGGVLDTEIHTRQAPIYTYLKSRGFYAGVQVDGTIILERSDENERFYGDKLSALEILGGQVRHPPYEIERLMETIKAAQGDSNIDESLIPTEAAPGDFEMEDSHTFGVPDKDDPDPYGVLALEKEGLSLKEASTKKRASWEEFTFSPSPASPIHSIYARPSVDISGRPGSGRNSWRSSAFSNESRTPGSFRGSTEFRRPSLMVDSSTQTDAGDVPISPGRRSLRSLQSNKGSITNTQSPMQDVPENEVLSNTNGYNTPPQTPPAFGASVHRETAHEGGEEHDKDRNQEHDHDDHDDEISIIEAPVVQSIRTMQPTSTQVRQVTSKARLVDVPKRVPPKLPPRNPSRTGPVIVNATPESSSLDHTNGSIALPAGTENASRAVTEHESLAAGTEPRAPSLEKVKLDDDDDDDDDDEENLRPNPWAKVEETRKHAKQYETEEPVKIPGGFE